MKYSINTTFSNENLVLNDSQQLYLFENLPKEMNEASLKYPRRKTRSIGEKKFDISEPSAEVSFKMKKIPSSNTSIELILERELKNAKLNYSKPEFIIESILGNPDFVIPKFCVAIFCDGDFWHGKNFEKDSIKSNSEFWNAKIEKNILRDEEVTYSLQEKQWKVFRFWESDIKRNPSECVSKILEYIKTEFPSKKAKFNFIDLFAGIGGFRIPLEKLGGKCLGFSEVDRAAIEVYKKNFFGFKNEDEAELGDITKLSYLPFKSIDLIVGGVPCQAWSVAGKMKGFDDPRGKLWDDSIRLVKLNQPKAFIFENVKGLIDPRNKANLELILSSLRKVGYQVKFPQLLNSYDFGLPQNRERVFIVGIRNDLAKQITPFEYPKSIGKVIYLSDILSIKSERITKQVFESIEIFGDKIPMGRNRFQKINELNDFFIFCDTRNGHTTIHSWDIIKTSEREKEICMMILRNRRKKIYGPSDGNPLSLKTLRTFIKDLREAELKSLVEKKILRKVKGLGYEFVNSKNSSGINGVYRVYLPHSNIFSTLTATGTKDYIALDSVEGKTPEEYKNNFIAKIVRPKKMRILNAKEAGLLQGFPGWFSIHPNESLAKKQFGNAVSTLVIENLATALLKTGIFRDKSYYDKKAKTGNI